MATRRRTSRPLGFALATAIAVVACGTAAVWPNSSVPAAPVLAGSAGPSASIELGGSGDASAAPSASPSTAPPPASVPPGTADPAKFGFLAKGLSHEVMAFVTTSQLSYGVE